MKRGIFISIFTRYIVSYIIVMAVLLTCIGAYMSNSFVSALHTEIANTNLNRLAILCMRHEEKLASLLSLSNQISLSDYSAPFKLSDEPMKAFYIIQTLAAFAASNDFCDQLYVVFNDDNYLYSSNTSVPIQLYTEKMMNYEYVSPDELLLLLRRNDSGVSILPSQATQSTLTNGANSGMVTFIMPLRLSGRFHAGNIMFLIQDTKYRQLFAGDMVEDYGVYIFHEGGVLSAERGLVIPDSIVMEAAHNNDEPVSELVTEEGEKYLLFTQSGSMFDMRYAALIPLSTVQARATRVLLSLCLSLLLLSLPCGLLTVYFSRRHVKPIRELQHSIGAQDQAKDGFTAIRDRIEALVGQNHDLNTRLSESLPARRAEFAKNFVKCRYAKKEDAIAAASELSLDINRKYFLLSLTDAVPDPLSAAKSVPSSGDVTCCGVEIEQYLSLVFSDSIDSLEAWTNDEKSIRGEDALIAVSNIHSDFTEAGIAYLEANTAYDNRFVMGGEHVLRFSDVSIAAKDTTFTRGYLDGFHKALHAGDARALNDRISELIQVLETKKFSLFAFRVIYNDIIRTLLGKYFSYDDALADARHYDIFSLSRCRRVSDLADILRRLCGDILDKVAEASQLTAKENSMPKSENIMNQIIGFMRDNYTDPAISMSAIAEKYGISPVRLSVDFKELTGMHPSDYLMLLRMDKAKELLIGTDLPIKEISAVIGYYDVSGFIRRFKKHMMETPFQYRQSVRKISGNKNEDE